jgi:hypothetical protein
VHAVDTAPANAARSQTMPDLVGAAVEGPETELQFHLHGLALEAAAAVLMRRTDRIVVSGVEMSMPWH